MFSVTTRMDPTSCSRIMEMGHLLMWPDKQVDKGGKIVKAYTSRGCVLI